MRELSLNILDIVHNSIKAKATEIVIDVVAEGDVLTVKITDNGKGMSKDFLETVTDPFTTTRNTRKVGMGVPLFKFSAESAGGCFDIKSELNHGTVITATYSLSNVDRTPMGDLAETFTSLIMAKPDITFVLNYVINKNDFTFNTKEFKDLMGGIPIDDYDVLNEAKLLIKNNIEEINGGLSI